MKHITEEKISEMKELLLKTSLHDGSHHKQYALVECLKMLCPDEESYHQLVEDVFEDDDEAPRSYQELIHLEYFDEGIPL